MLRELFETIAAQAVLAYGPHVHTVEGGESELIVISGEVTSKEPLPNRRQHQFASVEALKSAIGRWCDGGTVWHNEERVVVVFDDLNRRDVGVLPLRRSPQFYLLEKLGKDGLDHRTFIRTLRHDLAYTGVEGLLSLVRKVEFKRHNDGRSDIGHGKESLGRAVEAAVTTTDELPEEVDLSVPLYETEGCAANESVRCSLDIDISTERFSLVPLPGQLSAS